MRRRFQLEPLLHALLASAALVPAVSCGGSSERTEGSGGSNGTNGPALGVCDDASTDANGWVRCAGADFYHREASGTCASSVPRPATPTEGCEDADCAGMLYGHCWTPQPVPGAALTCIPGCVTDADCAANEVCFCEEPVGRCIPADCSVDADCGPNAFCSTYLGPDTPACAFHVAGVACQREGDACTGSDCNCAMSGGDRKCVQGLGGCGRPFLVGGAERRAFSAPRTDWSGAGAVPSCLAELSPELRARLAEHWTLAGLLEHASIAAFARFSLELLALGAPAALVEDAARATSDETRHAALCFSFAGAYAGAPVGPGPLAVGDCLGSPTLASVVETALLEGCLGETLAAAEARELARCATDPAVRDALELIAADETRHAALAYRFVRWALERDRAGVSALVRELIARERDHARRNVASGDGDARLLALGVSTEAFRAELRRDVVERVVLPCLESALAPAERRGTAAPTATA